MRGLPVLSDMPLFPEQASATAQHVDALYLFLVGVSLFFTVLIAALVVLFAIRYRRRQGGAQPEPIHGSTTLELVWTVIPLIIAFFIFGWGAKVFFEISRPPDDTMNIMVVGKRWMWKLEHMTGRREINELHVPVGRAVRLTLTSEDVIHSFYVPAFRVKADAVPGRYTTIWFRPTKPGRYHLFCAEYCGTEHSGMIGWIVVMEPAEFQSWLAGGAADVTPAAAGGRIFKDLGCATCHNPNSQGRGPTLERVFGSRVHLQGGDSAIATEAYLRESILDPAAKVVEGYQPVMPTFRGLISEEGILDLIEYIKTLAPGAGAGDAAGAPGAPGAPGATGAMGATGAEGSSSAPKPTSRKPSAVPPGSGPTASSVQPSGTVPRMASRAPSEQHGTTASASKEQKRAS